MYSALLHVEQDPALVVEKLAYSLTTYYLEFLSPLPGWEERLSRVHPTG
ncbi:MAG: hypothetical protein IH594_04460 [Bacteroidales bacterium]|nr:hypothetical protein [Bacteroidales bacterium]